MPCSVLFGRNWHDPHKLLLVVRRIRAEIIVRDKQHERILVRERQTEIVADERGDAVRASGMREPIRIGTGILWVPGGLRDANIRPQRLEAARPVAEKLDRSVDAEIPARP